MNDLLPGAVPLWQWLEEAVRTVTAAYGYAEIRTPVIERSELFRRSIGEQTDIVEKEMYTFTDNNGDSLTLRPEATASCVRAGLEHGLFHNQTARLWYAGPMFRHERPQKGRYRQFHQFGIEAVGWHGPDIDAEIIFLGDRLWRELGIPGIKLELNTLGSAEVRARYRIALTQYLQAHRENLDTDSLRRLERNPLRILDSKDPGTREVVENAPRLTDYLDAASGQHFEGLLKLLESAGIEYTLNTKLVRGLDYYTGPVFEWTTTQLGAQNAVCAGGRYDDLVAQLGGRPTPAAGFASGLERLVELIQLAQDIEKTQSPSFFVVNLGDSTQAKAFSCAENLRSAGHSVISNCGGGSIKNQLRRADRSGARYALIIGEDEVATSTVKIKSLRTDAPQFSVTDEELVARMDETLNRTN